MSSFFEFTKVTPPSFGDSANFMSNATRSVQGAADAFSETAKMFHDANVEKDTRIKQDNTDLWLHRISSAETQEEVDLIKSEIGSEQFQQQYGNGFAIDTNKLTVAADARPEAIKQGLEIKDKLASRDQNDVLSGYLTGVELASNDKQLDAVLNDSRIKGMTLSNQEKIIEAVEAKRSSMHDTAVKNAQIRNYERAAKEAQTRETYNRALEVGVARLMQKATRDGLTPDQIKEDPRLLAELVKLSGYSPSAVMADIGALVTGIASTRDAAAAEYVSQNGSPGLKDTVSVIENAVTQDTTAQEKTGQAMFTRLVAGGAIAEMLAGVPVTAENMQAAIADLQKRTIDTNVLSKVTVPAELMTMPMLTKLLAATDTASLDLAVHSLNEHYGSHVIATNAYNQTLNSARAKHKEKALDISSRMNNIIKEMKANGSRITEAQRNGAPADEVQKLIGANALLHDQLEVVKGEALRLNQGVDYYSEAKFTAAAYDSVSKMVDKVISPRFTILEKEQHLERFVQDYGLVQDAEGKLVADPKSPQAIDKNLIKRLNALKENVTKLKETQAKKEAVKEATNNAGIGHDPRWGPRVK